MTAGILLIWFSQCAFSESSVSMVVTGIPGMFVLTILAIFSEPGPIT